MKKQFAPQPSYECAKHNGQNEDPCMHCDECSVFERVVGNKCEQKQFYDYKKEHA